MISCDFEEKPRQDVSIDDEGAELLKKLQEKFAFEQIIIYRTEDYEDKPNLLRMEFWNGENLPKEGDDSFELQNQIAYSLFPHLNKNEIVGIEKFEVWLTEHDGKLFFNHGESQVLPLLVIDEKLRPSSRPLGTWKE